MARPGAGKIDRRPQLLQIFDLDLTIVASVEGGQPPVGGPTSNSILAENVLGRGALRAVAGGGGSANFQLVTSADLVFVLPTNVFPLIVTAR